MMRISYAIRLLIVSWVIAPLAASAQATDDSRTQQKLDQVLATLASMQQQLDASRQQIDLLQNQLRELHSEMQPATADPAGAAALRQSVQDLESQQEIQAAEIKQHDQTKVETASKFPVRVSGLLLFSSFLNNGAVDNIDLPIVALPRTATSTANGSMAATLRQTVLGIDAKGPAVWGARSAADAHVDFFGGVPYSGYTTATGNLRLRTAHVKLDWPDHALIAAFDSPLITALQPTSYLSIGEPPLSWSGNLWIWAPQLQSLNQRRFGPGTLHYDAALTDPVAPGMTAVNGERQPNPAEASRQPGYETRISYSIPLLDRPFTFGAGSHYNRQTYPKLQHIDAWTATADWRLPFTRWLELSGALYRGRAVAGLGGGVFKDYIESAAYTVHGLDSEGGWLQLKARLSRSVEGNVMLGEDAGFSSELHANAETAADVYSNLARNRTVIGNLTYRPKAYFYVSAEYRNIDSWPIAGHVNIAQSIGVGTGYSF